MEDNKHPLSILVYPDNRLLEKASEVVDFAAKIQLPDRPPVTLEEFGELLTLTMNTYQGVGLAATQVGVMKRVLVVRDLAKLENHVLVNPHVLRYEGVQDFKEGCLSFPGIAFGTRRFFEIAMSYKTVTGEEKIIEAKGMLAIELQHEFDHLDGVTLLQFITGAASRAVIMEKLRKFKINQKKAEKKMKEMTQDAKRYLSDVALTPVE
jgi:peptide deformylase